MNMQQATEIVSDAAGTLEPHVAEAIAYIVSAWSDKCDVLFLEKERLREALEQVKSACNEAKDTYVEESDIDSILSITLQALEVQGE